MASFFLFLHLLGALGMALLLMKSFIIYVQGQYASYSLYARFIAAGTAFQLVSGSLLALVSLTPISPLSLCVRIGFYLGVCIFIELLLLLAMLREGAVYPTRSVALWLLGGLSVASAIIIQGTL